MKPLRAKSYHCIHSLKYLPNAYCVSGVVLSADALVINSTVEALTEETGDKWLAKRIPGNLYALRKIKQRHAIEIALGKLL